MHQGCHRCHPCRRSGPAYRRCCRDRRRRAHRQRFTKLPEPPLLLPTPPARHPPRPEREGHCRHPATAAGSVHRTPVHQDPRHLTGLCSCPYDGQPRDTKGGTECLGTAVFHAADGNLDDLDLSGVDFAFYNHFPSHLTSGNWKVGLVVDSAASSEETGGAGTGRA
ncbi:DUF1326 domain-containing protein [Streptomyces sp. NPDC049627]|uniref:DUF1326 domain-containing protein n=1 Tax=Streptomyces sp. NPDC049627 TaxID=3365595 RepID=UPI0037B52150